VHTKINDHKKKYLNKKVWNFYKAARFYDPFQANKVTERNRHIHFAQQYEIDDSLITKYKLICANLDSKYKNLPPNDFWIDFKEDLFPLSLLALRVLQIPVSSAEVERSIKIYKKLVHSGRSNLSKDHAKQLVYVKINAPIVFASQFL